MNVRRTPGRARPARRRAARPAPASKRPPRQERGQKRYEELLDAAERVIAEVGVEAMTTNEVAARAGAGMGSLYHFFANKEAIVQALAERYVRAMLPLTAYAQQPELAKLSLAEMVDAIVDPLAGFFRRAPAYRHVFHAAHPPGGDPPCGNEMKDTVIRNVASIMASRAPHLEPRRRRVHAMVAVDLVHGLLGTAFDAPPSQRQAFIDETKRVLALYSEMITLGDDPLERLRGGSEGRA